MNSKKNDNLNQNLPMYMFKFISNNFLQSYSQNIT